MGEFNFFKLDEIIERYKPENYIEIGINEGRRLGIVSNLNLKHIYAIDISEDSLLLSKKNINSSNIIFIKREPSEALGEIYKDIFEGNSLFYIDFYSEMFLTNSFPRHMMEILGYRLFQKKDIILLDGVKKFFNPEDKTNLIYFKSFSNSHNIELINVHDGYVSITPKT